LGQIHEVVNAVFIVISPDAEMTNCDL